MLQCRSDKLMILSPGFQADANTLHKVLQQRYIRYQFDHGRPLSVSACAQLLGNTLYYKRFFPYYTFNICAGLDEEGELSCSQPSPAWGKMSPVLLSCTDQCLVSRKGCSSGLHEEAQELDLTWRIYHGL